MNGSNHVSVTPDHSSAPQVINPQTNPKQEPPKLARDSTGQPSHITHNQDSSSRRGCDLVGSLLSLVGLCAFGAFMLVVVCSWNFISTLWMTGDLDIRDTAHVLNATSIHSRVEKLPYHVSVITISGFVGSSDDLDQGAQVYIQDSGWIIILMDTTHDHLAVIGGSSVSDVDYDMVKNAFVNRFNNGNYTGATIAALQSVDDSFYSTRRGWFFRSWIIFAIIVSIRLLLRFLTRNRESEGYVPEMTLSTPLGDYTNRERSAEFSINGFDSSGGISGGASGDYGNHHH